MLDIILICTILLCLTLGIGFALLGIANASEKPSRIRSRIIKVVAVVIMVGGVCFSGLIFLALTLSSFSDSMCADEIMEQIVSPSGTNIVYVFTRDCGAVTSSGEMLPNVMLRDRLHPVQFQDRQIVARTDWLGRDLVQDVYYGELDSIKWLSDNHLQIQLPRGWQSNVRLQLAPSNKAPGLTSWNGIKISYTVPQPKGKKK